MGDPKTRELIDFAEPVGLMLIAIVHFLTDAEKPRQIVAALRDALPRGSYLALSHGTADFHEPAVASAVAAVYDRATAPFVLRGYDQVAALFDGWDVVEPGVVPVPLWRPEGRPPRSRDLARIGIYGGVGRLRP